MNALMRHKTVMLVPHAAIMQVVMIALVTLAIVNQDYVTLVNVITLTSASFHNTIVTKTPHAMIPLVVSNVNVMLVTRVTVLRALAPTSMNVMMEHIPVTKMPLVPIMMVVSLALVKLAGIPVETVKQVHAIMSMNALKLSTHTHVVPTQNVLILLVHMNAVACHHSIWLKVHVLMMMNVQPTTTTVTQVDQSVQMKPRPTIWNGSMVLLTTP